MLASSLPFASAMLSRCLPFIVTRVTMNEPPSNALSIRDIIAVQSIFLLNLR